METCYFDYNATAPLRPEAKGAWLSATDDLWLNPSSPYRAAARVHAHLAEARARVADLFAVAAERVVFNSGATEANNAIFAHWAATLPADARIGVSPTEHSSVLEAAKHFFGERVIWLALDGNGAVDVAALQQVLSERQLAAVSVMAANNETGILNDWAAIAAACRAQGVPYHCDASQWIGKLPLDHLQTCDFLTGAAHKFGGPKGVGLCLLPAENSGFMSLAGGAQEFGHRAGTEDVAGILAMVAALQGVECGSAQGRDAFLVELGQVLPAVEVIGLAAPRLCNTALLIMPEFASVRWIRALEKRGFLVSAGSACSTDKQGPSPVLAAMGVEAGAMQRALRVSSGWATSVADWMALAAAMAECGSVFSSEADDSTSTVISI
ncbi:MAG: cysteine desulfurase [Bacteroidia bacterium]|jgi:cysteine desulfurase